MSWFKSLSFSGGDVFDESGDELSLQSREWISNMKKRVRDGYVDGVDAGEEASLQLGFDMGFSEGAAQTAAVGRLKGIVSAIGCWCQFQHPENPVPASVCDLLQQVSQHEDAIMEGIKRALENPPPSVSDVSESMEELEVDQADQGCCGGGGGGCKEEDCCKGGGGGGGGGEKMEQDVPQRPQKLRSRSSAGSSSSGENFELLLQRCVDLVTELGLPQELIGHIRELKNM